MNRKTIFALFVVASTLTLAPLALAGNVYHSQSLTPAQDSPELTGFPTAGDEMAGMSVTVYFSAAPAETVTWMATGVGSGAANGVDSDWSMVETGDTWNSPWTLTYSGVGAKGLLIGFSLDGFAAGAGNAGVIFDRTYDYQEGTPGSANGKDLQVVNPVFFDVLAHYRGAVGIAGADPVGDEFRWLNVLFFTQPDDEHSRPQVSGLGGNVTEFVFVQDSNRAVAPEPASAALTLASGVLLLGLRRRG